MKREDLEALVKQFGLTSLEEFHSRYNIAPTSIVPLIRIRGETIPGGAEATAGSQAPNPAATTSLELAPVRWGLIPAWTKPDAPPRPLVNLRAETLVSRFRGALRHRRCVLPASGFYEWEKLGTRKQPWLFTARAGGPVGLAGVWDTWQGDGSLRLETCAILTTTPNGVLSPIHDRMPVMLTPEQCRTWLDPERREPELKALLASAPDEAIAATRVGPAVSSVRNDGPECIAAAAPDSGGAEPQLSLGF